jgi:3-isopropylmalate dehydrogenase
MADLRVVTLPGDGIGPEVTAAAVSVLEAVGRSRGHHFRIAAFPVGWAGVEAAGDPLPPATLAAALEADAVFLGAVGDPAADHLPPALRPEAGLLRLRRELGCFANLRPARLPEALVDRSPLRPEIARGTDLVIVRELAGGLYYGEPRSLTEEGGEARALNTLPYSASEVRRIARVAFELARERRRSVVSVDKANVLETSRLWRRVVNEVAEDFPDVALSHVLVDRMAMELVLRPANFDVLLMENLFGDILSDQAAGVVGSLGLLGSASLGGTVDIYEPVHGSAPDIAGRGVANPVGAILSAAMLLRHSAGLPGEARAVEAAVDRALADGARTGDVAPTGVRGWSTAEVTAAVVAHLDAELERER